MDGKNRYGSGRPLYWAHAAGPTERRGSVRCGDTAFELVPLATRRNPYENVLLIDVATHPRLIPAAVLQDMLPPGVHLSDLARRSMPGLDARYLESSIVGTETFWTVTDTTTAFARYWEDEEPLDASHAALDLQHRRIRALSTGSGDLPVNAFPVRYETVIGLVRNGMATLGDLTELDVNGVMLQTGLTSVEIARAYRTIQATLECRTMEISDSILETVS